MKVEPKSTVTTESEPTSVLEPVPMWLMGLLFVLLFLGAWYFDLRGGWFNPQVYEPYTSVARLADFQPRSGGDALLITGKRLFEANCALCHNTDGSGKPNQAPPLAGSEWVITEGANRVIRIPLLGLNGPIEVKGQQWNLNMAAMGAAYSDEDLAAVVSYIRNAWGNKAPLVTPAQVKAVRAEIGGRSQPYTPDELKSLPEK